jgi:hypothetical protein
MAGAAVLDEVGEVGGGPGWPPGRLSSGQRVPAWRGGAAGNVIGPRVCGEPSSTPTGWPGAATSVVQRAPSHQRRPVPGGTGSGYQPGGGREGRPRLTGHV